MIDPRIIEQIIRAWDADQNHPNKGRKKHPLRDPGTLLRFVEAAFFASIREEEGRPVNFSAVLISRTEANDPNLKYRTELLTLGTPVQFTADNIPKLAPALDPRLSSFAVELSSDGKELQIWGIFSFDPNVHLYNEIPIVVEGAMYLRHDFLTVSTHGRGALVFSRGNSVIGRIASGYFINAAPSPFTSLSLGLYLTRLFIGDEPDIQPDPNNWHYALKALEVLLDEASNRGHGATIAFVDGRQPFPDGAIGGKYVLKGEARLGPRIGVCIAHTNKAPSGLNYVLMDLGYRKLAFQSIQRVAQLSAVDGALIIDGNFCVKAFGTKLTAPTWQRDVIIGPDGYGIGTGERFEVERYGTRHRSALNFAGACDNSVVFVISQDGPIRAFTKKDDETVLCWPDCSTSMFI